MKNLALFRGCSNLCSEVCSVVLLEAPEHVFFIASPYPTCWWSTDDGLYESGQLPLLYAKEKAKSQGASWQREGQVVSYYCSSRQNSARLVIPFPNPFAFYITRTPAAWPSAYSSPTQSCRPIAPWEKSVNTDVWFLSDVPVLLVNKEWHTEAGGVNVDPPNG